MRRIFSLILMLVFVGIALILPGCEVDYYQEPEDSEGSGTSLFGEGITVPSGFDWTTMQPVNVHVEVDDRYDGKYYYVVEIFDSNPLFNEEATLFTKGVAKKGKDFATTVTLPKAMELVYIKQTTPTGVRMVTAVSVEDPQAVWASFKATETPSAPMSRSAGQLRSSTTESREMPSIDVPPAPASGVEVVSAVNAIKDGKSYIIPSGTTFDGSGSVADWTSGGTIYVDGTWNVTGDLNLIRYDVVVHDGGKIQFSGSGSSFTSRGNLIIANGGEILGNPIITIGNDEVRTGTFIGNYGAVNAEELLIQGGSTLYNYNFLKVGESIKSQNSSAYAIYNSGVINCGTIHITGSTPLYNFNTVEAVGIKTQNSSDAIIYNDKKISLVGDLDFEGSGAEITNNCSLTIEGTLTLNGSKIISNEGSSISASGINLNYSTINLFSDAILEAKGTLYFGSSQSVINGMGANFALVKAKNVIFSGWNVFRAYDNVVLLGEAFENKGKNEWTDSNYATSPAYITSDASAIAIPATECNGGGNNDPDPGTPTNPSFPIIHDGSVITYLFEDNWPYLGDYDMNDLVLDVKPVYGTNPDNKVEKLELEITLRAVGATKRLGLGIQLDGIIPGMISSIARSNNAGVNGNVFAQSNGLETGQTYVVIPVFDDVHEALGLSSPVIANTVKGSENNVSPAQVTFTVDFNVPLDQAAISIDKLNLFIINGGYKTNRQEVHLAGFQPTGKADTSKFGFADDNSTVKPYTSGENLIWALAVPGPGKYPVEWTSIRLAYSGLESWVTSGGAESRDWYNNPDESKIYAE